MFKSNLNVLFNWSQTCQTLCSCEPMKSNSYLPFWLPRYYNTGLFRNKLLETVRLVVPIETRRPDSGASRHGPRTVRCIDRVVAFCDGCSINTARKVVITSCPINNSACVCRDSRDRETDKIAPHRCSELFYADLGPLMLDLINGRAVRREGMCQTMQDIQLKLSRSGQWKLLNIRHPLPRQDPRSYACWQVWGN